MKKIQSPLLNSLRLKQKGLLHKVSGCQVLPFQNLFVQDSQVHVITKLHTKDNRYLLLHILICKCLLYISENLDTFKVCRENT